MQKISTKLELNLSKNEKQNLKKKFFKKSGVITLPVIYPGISVISYKIPSWMVDITRIKSLEAQNRRYAIRFVLRETIFVDKFLTIFFKIWPILFVFIHPIYRDILKKSGDIAIFWR